MSAVLRTTSLAFVALLLASAAWGQPELTPIERLGKLIFFDVAGRTVRTLLVDQRFGTGQSSVRWDGRTGTGMTAPPGVYFYRLQAGPQLAT